MQSFGTLLSDNKILAVVLAILIVVFVAAIALFLYRLVFGRRLHMTGGRSRQPRLGVVDAFDLDRQRQLVLIRRDNVEHLLMIGGPNDLVIESAFLRAQPSLAVPVGRDKEASTPTAPLIPIAASPGAPSAPLEPAEPRAPTPARAFEPPSPPPPPPPGRPTPPLELTFPVSPKNLGPLSDLPAPQPVATPQPAVPTIASTPAAVSLPPEPSRPVAAVAVPVVEPSPGPSAEEPGPPPPLPEPPMPSPPRPVLSRLGQGLPSRQNGGVLPPRAPLSALRTPGAAATGTLPRAPVQLSNRPAPSAPLQRGTSAASLRRDPPTMPIPAAESEDTPPFLTGEAGSASSGRGAPPPPQPDLAAPPPPAEAPAPAALPALRADDPSPPRAAPITLDSIESLEEEMAKLLGRAAASNEKK